MKLMTKSLFVLFLLLVAILLTVSISHTAYTVTKLTDNSYHDRAPQINANGYVAWEGSDGSDYEIFLYNGFSTTQLTNNVYFESSPQISANGHVVWECLNGSDYEIFRYNGSTLSQLTSNAYDDY